MKQRNVLLGRFRRQLPMHVFVWLGLAFLFIFSFLPLTGMVVAFRDFKVRDGFTGMFTGEFVGWKYFQEFFNDRKFTRLLQNTVIISVLKLGTSFPIAIIFAIFIHEMPGRKFKRIVQTVSYLPHFISWVIVAGIFFAFFSTNTGVLNDLFMRIGLIDQPLDILNNSDKYYALATLSELWKETGWNAIIYLAAISGIDSELYEAAQIDGAGRLKRIRHITIPGIKGTIAVLLILNIGSLLSGANFDQAMMLGNSMNISRSEILPVHIYETGLGLGRYSYATAVGLIQSVVSMILVLSANAISKRAADTSIF